MALFHFICTECGKTYREHDVELTCPVCEKLQVTGSFARGVLHVELESFPKVIAKRGLPINHPEVLASHWPVKSAADVPSYPVGDTPLLPAPGIRKHLNLKNFWLKDDTRNPSGSTKDRASLLVAIKAKEYRKEIIVTASTGNAATALAAVTAGMGLKSVVFVPATAPRAKLVQMMNYGAKVIPVRGTYDDAFELSIAAAKKFNWYNRNTALNPFTIEGKKTLGIEIIENLTRESKAPRGAREYLVPDVVIIPVGDGVILAGIAKGFSDLKKAGLISRVPRLLAVQPEMSSVIVRSLELNQYSKKKAKNDILIAKPSPANSVADSLNVAMPRNALLAVKEILSSGGDGVIVDDEAILDAIQTLSRLSGVFPEPAGATAFAGLLSAIEQKLVTKNETIVLVVTGTGLKDITAAAEKLAMPEPISPTMESLTLDLLY